jgi:Family of unknown function (DUF6134)
VNPEVRGVDGRRRPGYSERHEPRQYTDPLVIGRRALLATMASAAAREADAELPVPPGNTLAFRLVRHGDEIGRHTASFERSGDQLTVRVAVDALVTVVSIPLVRYTHRVVEVWSGDSLLSLNGETDKNGQHEWVKAQRGPAGVMVTGSKTERYIAAEPVGATSYWNKRVLDKPMIGLEDGVLLRPKVVARPPETIALASGRTIAAEHYNLSGPFNVDLWYDRTGMWAGMEVPIKDGSIVRYERL